MISKRSAVTMSGGMRPLYAIIMFTAFSMLAVQITLTRVLSVTLYYHYAFATISFLMLGLTTAALKIYKNPDYYSAGNAYKVIVVSMAQFAVFLWLAALLHVVVPSYWLSASALVIDVCWLLSGLFGLCAFTSGGVIISLLLTRFPAAANRLYAADLIGAALGCLGVWVALDYLDPLGVIFVIATLSLVVAWCLRGHVGRWLRALVALLLIVSGTLSLTQAVTYALEQPMLRVLYVRSGHIETPIFERWNTYSRIAIAPLNPLAYYLTIDIDAGTVMHKFDGNPAITTLLKGQIMNLGYQVRLPKSVAVVGVGGARDVHSALLFGVERVDGIEMNPITLNVLTGRFGEFTGHLDRNPAVRLINAEARSYLNTTNDQYDMLQISLIDTWAVTAAGGLTLSENKLYTVEAWQEFLGRLNPNGMISITRWFEAKKHPAEFYRLVALAQKSLEAMFIGKDARYYVLAAAEMNGNPKIGGMVTMLLSVRPFSNEEVKAFEAVARERNYRILLSPSESWDITTSQIAGGQDKDYFRHLPMDVSPPTDDRPFFFYMERFIDLFFSPHDELSETYTANYKNNMAVRTLFGIMSLTFLAALWFVGKPLLEMYRQQVVAIHSHKRFALYFAMIGLGYMLIEIATMQRLTILLGHPSYGLVVVLFTMLLFSGLGSYALQLRSFARLDDWIPLFLTLLLLLTLQLTPVATEYIKHMTLSWRIAGSVLLLAPISFFMGMMFPLGVAHIRDRAAELLPWFWGINGVFSVFGSVLAVAYSIQFGIAQSFMLGIICYCVCGICLSRHVR